jgi:hypothetical protein
MKMNAAQRQVCSSRMESRRGPQRIGGGLELLVGFERMAGLVRPGDVQAVAGRRSVSVRAQAVSTKLTKSAVPLELEKGEMPLNTYNNKNPFIAKVKSVEKIVGPKATGETYHIIIETGGKIPFWEGQSYGVIPPVSCGVLEMGCNLANKQVHGHVCSALKHNNRPASCCFSRWAVQLQQHTRMQCSRA